MVWAWELNVILHLDIFVHYDEQVKESHLILCCVPSYTSYQDSLGTLTIDSHSCLTLTFSCPNFYHTNLPAKGPRRVRQGSLEPICDGLANTVFQGQAMHIPVETLILDDHSSMQKVFGHPTSLYEVVFSMTNVLSIYDNF